MRRILLAALVAALSFSAPVFAQEGGVVVAPVATVADATVVAPTPAVEKAVVEQAWWAGLADQMIAALATIAVAAVGTLTPFAVQFIRSRSKLAGVLITQGLVDKMSGAIQNQIRVEADKLRLRVNPDAQLSTVEKTAIVQRVQPVIAERFKETRAHLNMGAESKKLSDMILGRVDEALAQPASAPLPYPLNK